MTILPKKKSSQPKSDRDSSGSVDNFTNRGLPQNQVSFFLFLLHISDSVPPYLVELEKKIIMADTLFTLVSTWTLIQLYFIMRTILDRLEFQNWTFEDFFGLGIFVFWRLIQEMTLGYIRNYIMHFSTVWSKCQVLQGELMYILGDAINNFGGFKQAWFQKSFVSRIVDIELYKCKNKLILPKWYVCFQMFAP